MGPGLIVSNEFLGCHIPYPAVCALLVVFSAPRFDDELRVPLLISWTRL